MTFKSVSNCNRGPFLTHHLYTSKKLCVWIMRITVILGLLIEKKKKEEVLVERRNHLNKQAEACVIPRYFLMDWSREWSVIVKYFVSQYLSLDALKNMFLYILWRIKIKPSPGRKSLLILTKQIRQVDSSVTPFNKSRNWNRGPLICHKSFVV